MHISSVLLSASQARKNFGLEGTEIVTKQYEIYRPANLVKSREALTQSGNGLHRRVYNTEHNTCVVVIGKFVCFIMFRSRSAISTTRNFVQSCACAHVRFNLRYAEIALEAICHCNYARLQIEMYEPGY